MTENNNWPGKPGVPLNPEKDGYHRLKSRGGDKDFILEWSASNGWITMLRWSINTIVEFMAYVGPVLSHDDATALQARVAELERALDFYACVDHYQIHNAAAPNVVQFDRGAKARAALEGKKA